MTVIDKTLFDKLTEAGDRLSEALKEFKSPPKYEHGAKYLINGRQQVCNISSCGLEIWWTITD